MGTFFELLRLNPWRVIHRFAPLFRSCLHLTSTYDTYTDHDMLRPRPLGPYRHGRARRRQALCPQLRAGRGTVGEGPRRRRRHLQTHLRPASRHGLRGPDEGLRPRLRRLHPRRGLLARRLCRRPTRHTRLPRRGLHPLLRARPHQVDLRPQGRHLHPRGEPLRHARLLLRDRRHAHRRRGHDLRRRHGRTRRDRLRRPPAARGGSRVPPEIGADRIRP